MSRSCVLCEVGNEILYAMEVNMCINFERSSYDMKLNLFPTVQYHIDIRCKSSIAT